jgi:phosphoribosyl 1,2-cyclic phosphodiesterase
MLMIDAGTGARGLGQSLAEETGGRPIHLNLLLTHFHWDHIQGIPFFTPLYSSENQVAFWSGFPAQTTREVLEGQMAHPYFPVPFAMLAARREVRQLTGEPQNLSDFQVRTFPLNHPQGAWGYRVETSGKSIVHASDFEHGDSKSDAILRDFAQGADLLIYDAQFTPEEYPSHVGWGHSTWLEAARVAQDAGVGRLVLFHHHPDHDDAAMDRILAAARGQFDRTEAAVEGQSIFL